MNEEIEVLRLTYDRIAIMAKLGFEDIDFPEELNETIASLKIVRQKLSELKNESD